MAEGGGEWSKEGHRWEVRLGEGRRERERDTKRRRGPFALETGAEVIGAPRILDVKGALIDVKSKQAPRACTPAHLKGHRDTNRGSSWG